MMKSIFRKDGGHYNIFTDINIEELKSIFPNGEANELNFVLFSTSGIHGTGSTIEEQVRRNSLPLDNEEYISQMTVDILIIHPRLVCIKFDTIDFTVEDVEYLKKLRDSSMKAIMKIGY
jgi:hypothetical protein